jgi:hypothetical protein
VSGTVVGSAVKDRSGRASSEDRKVDNGFAATLGLLIRKVRLIVAAG